MSTGKLTLAGVVTLALLYTTASASLVGMSDWTGSRATIGTSSPSNGLVWNPSDGKWSNGNFSLSWVIEKEGGNYTYEYTIDSPADARLSHWILELSPEDSGGNDLEAYWEGVFSSFESTGIGGAVLPGEVGEIGGNNPGIPGDIWGVKFEEVTADTSIVSFTTPQVPVWGNFYAIDGGGTGADAVYAYNSGFMDEPPLDRAADFTRWIPRPDGEKNGDEPGPVPGVPEAGTFAIWSLLGVCGLAWARFGRKRVV